MSINLEKIKKEREIIKSLYPKFPLKKLTISIVKGSK